MTVINPNSVAGINSITVQSGEALSVHKSDGTLIQTIVSSTGISTFSSVSVGSATTTNNADKSINIGLGASISQHAVNSLSFGTSGDPVAKFDASGHFLPNTDSQFNIGSNSVRFANGYFDTLYGDGSNLSNITSTTINSNADNRIITGSGSANTLNGESNLTFDGSALAYSAGGAERLNIAHTSGGIVAIKNPSNSALTFGTNNTERIRILSGGGVGIGTEVPDFEFTVADMSGAAVIRAKDGANNKIVDMIANSTGGLVRTIGSYPLVLNTNQTERLRIGPSGGVGISTDKIRNADFLHIATASQDFTNPTEELMDGGGICLQNTDNLATTGRTLPGIFWASNVNELGRARAGIIGVAANNHDATDIVFVAKYLPGGDGLYPRDERMRIRAQSGYIGINTSLPDRQLHIVGNDGPTQATSGNSDTILVLDNKGSNGAIVEFKGDNDGAGRIMFTDTDTSNQGRIEYLHSSDTLQFTSAGGNPGYELQSDQKSRFNVVNSKVLIDKNNTGIILDFDKSGTGVGNISITSSNTSYNTSGSDRALKKNFENWTENTLDLFKNINPQKFNFIHEEDTAEKSKGFIAQEMVASFPEAYTKEDTEDSKYFFNPSGMVVYLMKAIQELEAKVATLEGG